MTSKISFILLIGLCVFQVGFGQIDRWQQRVSYQMDIDFVLKKHQINGKQHLEYTNNSPDTLDKVFYHLYFNAFQPNSEMDVNSRQIVDPDKRVGDRISKLEKDEMGYQVIHSLTMNGKAVKYQVVGTILEVTLVEPILPHSTVVFDMDFKAQVPLQIRRSGRFNKEGIEYSMSQWYPKMCNYDYQGWHANPYIGREFYGIWGDYDVKITMPSQYIIAGTGTLQNKDEIGYGYSAVEPSTRPKMLTWHFRAQNVHDFVWAADPDYKQIEYKAYNGTILRFFYQPGEMTTENWEHLPPIMDECLKFMNEKYGQYPYGEYSFIQGGDGGMEYPMATLITGERNTMSLIGVAVHEWMHSWYQMILATNESLYPWMDEGFTSYGSNEVMNHLKVVKMIAGEPELDPHLDEVRSFANFAMSGKEEALITHADRYKTNTAYGVASYTKGEVFLEQIRYIIGEKAFDKGMLSYFENWKFKHPNPNDFIRIMEKESGLELDWFKEEFVNTTHIIDYGIENINAKILTIQKKGDIPMPLDITVIGNDGKEFRYYIPLEIMRGEKVGDRFFSDFKVMKDWNSIDTTYKLRMDLHIKDIRSINIDASQKMVDVYRNDNTYPREAILEAESK